MKAPTSNRPMDTNNTFQRCTILAPIHTRYTKRARGQLILRRRDSRTRTTRHSPRTRMALSQHAVTALTVRRTPTAPSQHENALTALSQVSCTHTIAPLRSMSGTPRYSTLSPHSHSSHSVQKLSHSGHLHSNIPQKHLNMNIHNKRA